MRTQHGFDLAPCLSDTDLACNDVGHHLSGFMGRIETDNAVVGVGGGSPHVRIETGMVEVPVWEVDPAQSEEDRTSEHHSLVPFPAMDNGPWNEPEQVAQGNGADGK